MDPKNDSPIALRETGAIARQIPLSLRGQSLAASAPTPAALVQRLLEQELAVDALRVLPCTMPIRRAVWWGVLSTWHSSGGTLPPAEDEALRAAVQWVVKPSTMHAQDALKAATGDLLETAAGCCARAAAMAGSAGPDGKFLPDNPLSSARLVSVAVIHACARTRERQPRVTYRHFVELGIAAASGKLDWEPSAGV